MPPVPLTPAAPPSIPLKRNRWPLVLALMLILGGLVSLYFVRMPARDAHPALRFMSGSYEMRTLRELSHRGATQVTLPVSGNVIEYARRGAEAAIVREGTGDQSVYVLGTEPERIATGLAPKSALIVSEDGTLLAYAERDTTIASTSSEFYSPEFWVVHVYNVATKVNQIMGVGYAPQLFTLAGVPYLSYTTPFGIRFVNVVTKQTADLSVQISATDGRLTPVISPDGTLIAIPNTVASRYSLFDLMVTEGTFSLTPRGDLLEHTSSVTFSNGKVYGVSRNSTESFFYVADPRNVADAVEIGRVPQTLVYSIAP